MPRGYADAITSKTEIDWGRVFGFRTPPLRSVGPSTGGRRPRQRQFGLGIAFRSAALGRTWVGISTSRSPVHTLGGASGRTDSEVWGHPLKSETQPLLVAASCPLPHDVRRASLAVTTGAQASIIFRLAPRSMRILRGLAFSATGMRISRTPFWYSACTFSVSRFSPKIN
jgi:hypothetical protein